MLRWIVVISSALIVLITATTTDNNCLAALEKVKQNFFCDDYLISDMSKEIRNIKRLFKYISYKMNDIKSKLKEECSNFKDFSFSHYLNCTPKIIYRSCKYAMTGTSGVYQLKDKNDKLYYGYCMKDPDGGEPWTIIQRRSDKRVSFQRDPPQFTNGFGDLYGDFWLGLDKVYQLTTERPFELWIQMTDFQNHTTFAKYDRFAVSGGATQFFLNALGAHSGTAWDSLRVHEGHSMFVYGDWPYHNRKCVQETRSGWWVSGCGQCNLNGEYFENGKAPVYGAGVVWKNAEGNMPTLKYVHMAIREKFSDYC